MGKRLEVRSEEHPKIAEEVEGSLELSVKEGALSSLSTGFGTSYLSPFAIAMNATASQIGILHGMINLFPSIIQLRASSLIKKISAKKIVIWGVLFQVFLWFLVILLSFSHYLGLSYSIWILIAIASLIYGIGAIIYPAWFLWMGFLVPPRIRGKYFSRRNFITGLFGIASMFLSAIILDKISELGFGKNNFLFYSMLGFAVIFFLAIFFRLWSLKIIQKTYSPKIKIEEKDYFSFRQFLKKAPSTPFGRFTIFRAFLSIAIGIATPFTSVYLLRNLGLSYSWFMAITVSAVFFQLIFLPLLGKVSDRFGNIALTRISVGLLFSVPALWAFSALIKNPVAVRWYLLFVPSIVSGFAWAGYNLATNNYVYDSVRSNKRGFGSNYMTLIVGVCMFLGSIMGSFLSKLPIIFMDPILLIFSVSAVARLFVLVFGIRFLTEVRPVQKFSARFLIKEFKPLHEIAREISYMEQIMGIKHPPVKLKFKHQEQPHKDISLPPS
ncbi:MAG: MFS transporter [Candidatus Pacearchaeota archaeon]